MKSSFENLSNSQNFQIVSFVLSFCKDHFLKEKSYWVALANFRHRRIWIEVFIGHVIRTNFIQTYLAKDFSNSKARSINLYLNINALAQNDNKSVF